MIVQEIMHWRRNRLLPEQYCDFLLNLYADEEEQAQLKRQGSLSATGKAIDAIQKATGLQWFLTLGTFTLISIIVFYFSRFPLIMQMAIILIGSIGLLWIGQRLRNKSETTGIAAIGIAMLLFLGGGLYIIDFHEWEHMLWKVGLLFLCSLLWIGCGILLKVPLLHLCGWLAALLVYGWMLYTYTEEPKWFEFQLYWLPLTGIFIWCCWFFHRSKKNIAAVLFVVGIVCWFLPEGYALLVDGGSMLLQLQLLIKIATSGAMLFLLRRRWMVWVI